MRYIVSRFSSELIKNNFFRPSQSFALAYIRASSVELRSSTASSFKLVEISYMPCTTCYLLIVLFFSFKRQLHSAARYGIAEAVMTCLQNGDHVNEVNSEVRFCFCFSFLLNSHLSFMIYVRNSVE